MDSFQREEERMRVKCSNERKCVGDKQCSADVSGIKASVHMKEAASL